MINTHYYDCLSSKSKDVSFMNGIVRETGDQRRLRILGNMRRID